MESSFWVNPSDYPQIIPFYSHIIATSSIASSTTANGASTRSVPAWCMVEVSDSIHITHNHNSVYIFLHTHHIDVRWFSFASIVGDLWEEIHLGIVVFSPRTHSLMDARRISGAACIECKYKYRNRTIRISKAAGSIHTSCRHLNVLAHAFC